MTNKMINSQTKVDGVPSCEEPADPDVRPLKKFFAADGVSALGKMGTVAVLAAGKVWFVTG